jgi:hypothetical protein
MTNAVGRAVPKGVDPTWRVVVGARFEAAVSADFERRLLDAYVTAGPVAGTGLTASITVSTVDITEEDGADPDRLLLARVTTNAATPLDLDGSVGVLWTAEVPIDPDADVPMHHAFPQRVVLARIPGVPGLLLTLVLSVSSAVVEAAPPLRSAELEIVGAFETMFEALLTTFRWTGTGGIPTRARETDEHDR